MLIPNLKKIWENENSNKKGKPSEKERTKKHGLHQ